MQRDEQSGIRMVKHHRVALEKIVADFQGDAIEVYRLYDFAMFSIKVDKLFDPCRNEEGFKELLKKMGME
ncbi:MAG TPA: hypothetical protein VF144_16660 [Chitinophagaceae bacterium]